MQPSYIYRLSWDWHFLYSWIRRRLLGSFMEDDDVRHNYVEWSLFQAKCLRLTRFIKYLCRVIEALIIFKQTFL